MWHWVFFLNKTTVRHYVNSRSYCWIRLLSTILRLFDFKLFLALCYSDDSRSRSVFFQSQWCFAENICNHGAYSLIYFYCCHVYSISSSDLGQWFRLVLKLLSVKCISKNSAYIHMKYFLLHRPADQCLVILIGWIKADPVTNKLVESLAGRMASLK